MPLRSYTHPPSGREHAANIPFKKKQNAHIEHNKVAGKIMENSPWLQMYVFFWKKTFQPAMLDTFRYCIFIEWKVHLKL